MDVTLADALEALTILPDWEQRFTYLMDMAAQLPPMPEADKTEPNKVRGCTSQVWMTTAWDDHGCLVLHLDSDAVLVKGLLALVWLAHQSLTRDELATVDLPALLAPTGLMNHLSPNRRNGFSSVLKRLKGEM